MKDKETENSIKKDTCTRRFVTRQYFFLVIASMFTRILSYKNDPQLALASFSKVTA